MSVMNPTIIPTVETTGSIEALKYYSSWGVRLHDGTVYEGAEPTVELIDGGHALLRDTVTVESPGYRYFGITPPPVRGESKFRLLRDAVWDAKSKTFVARGDDAVPFSGAIEYGDHVSPCRGVERSFTPQDFTTGSDRLMEAANLCGCSECTSFLHAWDPGRIQPCKAHNLYHAMRLREAPEGDDLLKAHSLGFEVEVSACRSWGRSCAPEGDLYAYWETDGSCGFEGVTHAYALNAREKFIEDTHALAWVFDSEEATSRLGWDTPQINSSCGGHFTLVGPTAQIWRWRPFAGLLYAMWRHRLRNTYCGYNLRLLDNRNEKYSSLRARHIGAIEFRIPTAVKRAQTLANRFDLMAALVPVAASCGDLADAIEAASPVLRRIYCKSRMENLVCIAGAMQDYIETGTGSPLINKFI